jgi:hypothetical protein
VILTRETPEIVDLDWENLGFALVSTDFMYMAKCGPDGNFSKGEMVPFGPIALSPSAGVLNYGQVSEWLGGWTWNGRPCFILSAVE